MFLSGMVSQARPSGMCPVSPLSVPWGFSPLSARGLALYTGEISRNTTETPPHQCVSTWISRAGIVGHRYSLQTELNSQFLQISLKISEFKLSSTHITSRNTSSLILHKSRYSVSGDQESLSVKVTKRGNCLHEASQQREQVLSLLFGALSWRQHSETIWEILAG